MAIVPVTLFFAYALAAAPTAFAGDNLDFQFLSKWGHSGSGGGEFNSPVGIAVDPTSGRVFVADPGNNRIQYFDESGSYLGALFGSMCAGGEFLAPMDVAVRPTNGRVFVADTFNDRIEYFDPAAGGYECKGTFGQNGKDDGQFVHPGGIAVNPATGIVYVADTGNGRIQRFNLKPSFWKKGTYTFIDFWKPAAMKHPEDVAVDASSGDVYVVDGTTGFAGRYNADGTQQLAEWGSIDVGDPDNLIKALGIAIDSATHHVYVAMSGDHRIDRFDAAGHKLGTHGSQGTGDGEFNTPAGVATNPATGEVYVADTLNSRIQRFRLAPAQETSPAPPSRGAGAETPWLKVKKVKYKRKRGSSKSRAGRRKLICKVKGTARPSPSKVTVTFVYRRKKKLVRLKPRKVSVKIGGTSFQAKATLPPSAKRVRATVRADFEGGNTIVSKLHVRAPWQLA